MKRSKSGFSLLELLVVISIISILIAMGTVAFTTTQRKSRDSRRRGDLQQMQKAFEQFYSEPDNTSYDTCLNMATTSVLPGGLPKDPQSGDDYSCTGDASEYCACAELEEEGTGNSGANCAYAAGGNYFCVSNLQ